MRRIIQAGTGKSKFIVESREQEAFREAAEKQKRDEREAAKDAVATIAALRQKIKTLEKLLGDANACIAGFEELSPCGCKAPCTC